jgi:hypothetical protein
VELVIERQRRRPHNDVARLIVVGQRQCDRWWSIALLTPAFEDLPHAAGMGYIVIERLGDGLLEFARAVVVEQLHQLGGGTRQRGAAVRGLL